MDPTIVPRSEHTVSRQDIDEDAKKVLTRLLWPDRNRRRPPQHQAYLVGGGVRDLMLGIRPKDFDIATSASPRQVKKLFGNSRIIGRRFQLVHVTYGKNVIEVATFRSSGESDQVERDGELIRRDNVFGTPEEDALRRDLTINALFYNIADFTVIDYVGGVEDLRAGIVRMIGDPVQSFREDPVRILRAIRHATRLDFTIEPETDAAIESEKHELLKVNQARLLEELYKDLCSGVSRPYFQLLLDRGILDVLAPDLVDAIYDTPGGEDRLFDSLERLDRYHADGEKVTHAIGLSALFSPIICPVAEKTALEEEPPHPPSAPFQAALAPVLQNLKIYRRDEERLWYALGAWPKLLNIFEKGAKIPKELHKRHYYPEAVEIFGLLNEPTDDLDDFLYEARSFPPPEEEAPSPRRGQRSRRGGRSRSSKSRPKKSKGAPAQRGSSPKSGSDKAGQPEKQAQRDGAVGSNSAGGNSKTAANRKRRRRRKRRTTAARQGSDE